MRQSGIELNVLSRGVWPRFCCAGQCHPAARLLSKQRSLTYDAPLRPSGTLFASRGCRTPKTSLYSCGSSPACKDGRSRLSTWTTGQSAFGIPEVPIQPAFFRPYLWIARWKTTTLVIFGQTRRSTEPAAALFQGTDGNLYGTTARGGVHGNGTIFKSTASGTLTTMYSFCSLASCADGSSPLAALIQATDGNFYGTTQGGGAYNFGTVFKFTPGGTETTLYSFSGGNVPLGGLTQASDGSFYGTTSQLPLGKITAMRSRMAPSPA